MLKRNVLELWSTIKERLSPTDFMKINSLLLDFTHGRIEKTKFISFALPLFEKDNFLHRRFTDFLHRLSQEDEEDGETRYDEATEMEEGEIREDHLRDPEIEDEANHLEIGVEVDENPKEDPLQKIEENAEEDYFAKIEEIGLEGKRRKRGILHGKDSKSKIERSPKETRKSKRLEQVTPSYKHILKEEQSPVSDTVLNNKYKLVGQRKGDVWNHKKLTEYEEVMAKCEDDMYEADMLMEALKSAVESAENVMSGEMRMEDVGVKFYRCIDQLYGGLDMAETVRENQQKALPLIVRRLKQKMDELKVARERWIPLWKQVFEENSAKQRD